MEAPRRNPPARAGLQGPCKARLDNGAGLNSTLGDAAVKALETELFIILAAADRMARGYPLAWGDHDRLHAAHQHVLRVLAGIRGREVTQ